MSGPLLLIFLAAAVVLIGRYRGHAQKVVASIAKTMTPSALPAGNPPTSTSHTWRGKWWKLALAGTALIAVAFGGLLPPTDWFRHAPSFAQVSEWAWNHWLILFMACGSGVIVMRTASAKAAHQFAGVPIGILAFLLVFAPIAASPIGIWVRTQLGVTGYSRPLCADFSPDASHSCNLTEAWSLPIGVDRLTYKDEYFRCVNVPDPKILEWRTVGVNEIEYRSTQGIIPARYRLESNPSCPVTP